jgi:hypothetical protein
LPRFAAGQPAKRSHTPPIRAASSAEGASGKGDASVMSKAPPRIPRRMFTLRIFPPESTGNKYRGDTNRSLGRELMEGRQETLERANLRILCSAIRLVSV